jgi:aspartyl-tRNA(Asn)/glutamyl-tRNA(Gln) amidotransferase subunit A
MTSLRNLTIKKFHEGLVNKEFSALEIAQAHFAEIKTKDKEIHAYLSLAEETALREAEAVDLAVARDEEVGMLAGVPLAIKDNILIKGLPATAGSKILENYTASYDATVIQKLKHEGAVFLGKANCDEFAMGSSTENSAFQITHNPHDLSRVPGGSSGGSVAAVAAHMALGALGSDTGGSIRQPSSLCGTVGLKPTYGAVSRSGVIAMASSLDQVGTIAKTVEDAAILFKGIAGRDPLDATSSDHEYADILDPKLDRIKSLTIGLPEEFFIDGIDPAVREAIERAVEKLKGLGLKFKSVSLPRTKYALSAYYIIVPAEVSANLARYDGIRYGAESGERRAENLKDIYFKTRGELFGAEAKRRIILGTYVLSSGYYDAYYDKAQRVRQLIRQDFDRAFESVDVLLTPVAPTPAFKIGEKIDDPLSMYLGDIFTLPVNMAGLPGISIPAPVPDGALPVGFQLIGQRWHEADILGIGQYYEKLSA